MTDEIPWEALFSAATAAREHAHAPYSHFPVGAAVLAGDGQIYAGCNVENASYGLSVCAERHAVGRAVGEGHRDIRAVAVITDAVRATPPCGVCRQVIAEFARPETPVRSRTLSGAEETHALAALLPHAFTKDFL